jgi:hypothetical protein
MAAENEPDDFYLEDGRCSAAEKQMVSGVAEHPTDPDLPDNQ